MPFKVMEKHREFVRQIEAFDYKQKYLNGYSFDNYLDRVIEGIE